MEKYNFGIISPIILKTLPLFWNFFKSRFRTGSCAYKCTLLNCRQKVNCKINCAGLTKFFLQFTLSVYKLSKKVNCKIFWRTTLQFNFGLQFTYSAMIDLYMILHLKIIIFGRFTAVIKNKISKNRTSYSQNRNKLYSGIVVCYNCAIVRIVMEVRNIYFLT